MKNHLVSTLVLLSLGVTAVQAQLLNDVTQFTMPAKAAFSPRLRPVNEVQLFPPSSSYAAFLDYPFSNVVVRRGVQYHLGNRNTGVYLKSGLASYRTATSEAGSIPIHTFTGSLATESHALFYQKLPNKKTLQFGVVIQNFLHPVTGAFFKQPATTSNNMTFLMGIGGKN